MLQTPKLTLQNSYFLSFFFFFPVSLKEKRKCLFKSASLYQTTYPLCPTIPFPLQPVLSFCDCFNNFYVTFNSSTTIATTTINNNNNINKLDELTFLPAAGFERGKKKKKKGFCWNCNLNAADCTCEWGTFFFLFSLSFSLFIIVRHFTRGFLLEGKNLKK